MLAGLDTGVHTALFMGFYYMKNIFRFIGCFILISAVIFPAWSGVNQADVEIDTRTFAQSRDESHQYYDTGILDDMNLFASVRGIEFDTVYVSDIWLREWFREVDPFFDEYH